jgi:hypothetical protein
MKDKPIKINSQYNVMLDIVREAKKII